MRKSGIIIFVRHSDDCKHADAGEFYKHCNCRKHFRWTHNGKQYRRKAGTASWTAAEKAKLELQTQLDITPAEAAPPKPVPRRPQSA